MARARSGSFRRRIAIIVAAALVVIGVGEAGARVVSPYLAEPQLYGDAATRVKVAQMDERGQTCVDVVVAGNSMGRDAFSPSAFTAADPTGRRAYNASLDAASPELLDRWLPEEVLPRLHPATVIVTLASLDFNAEGNATRSALSAYETAALTAPGTMGRLGAWASGRSTLVRFRTELRDPGAFVDALGRAREGNPAERPGEARIDGVLGRDGEGLSRQRLTYRHDAGTKAFTRDQLLARFRLDDSQVRATTNLIGRLDAEGISVVLVVLPVTPDYVALHPNGEADFAGFLAAVQGVARDTGAPLIDLHTEGASTDERFADTHHLNGTGQRWFSAGLPERLRAAGVPPDRRCP